MADWLEELRQEREKAIEQARSREASGSLFSPEEKLKNDQDVIARLIETVAIEPSLQQFSDEVLRDHPLFINPALMRTVVSRSAAEMMVQEQKEPAPWSGPVQNNFLPSDLNPGKGRYVFRIEWRLNLNYRFPNSHQIQQGGILITASAKGVQVHSHPLPTQTAGAFKTALVNTFREVTSSAPTPAARRRHHRHRSWYNRLWMALFPPDNPTRLYAVIVVVVMVLLAVVIALLATRGLSILR